MSEIVTLFCPVDAKKGCGEKLKAALIALTCETRKEAGCICYRLHSTPDPDRFLIYEQWKNAQALDDHCKSPHLKEFLADKEGILLEDPQGAWATEINID